MVSLKVISQLKTHEKLSTKGDSIQIESQSFWTSWTRWWRHESRHHNITTVETILDSAFNQLTLRMSQTQQTPQDWVFFDRLSSELIKTRKGIYNLQETYYSCSLTQATLDCVLEKIDSNMTAYNAFKNALQGTSPPPPPPPSPSSPGEGASKEEY